MGLFVLDVQKYYVLTARGMVTKGKIVGFQPNNHRAVVYEYQTAEGDFSGAGRASDIDADFDQLRLGDTVTVFRDPSNAGLSCLGTPKQHFGFIGNSRYFGIS
ncbi:MAG TPA: DUF3592 domain-containing protein [Pyrinomonadaceae bacterium]